MALLERHTWSSEFVIPRLRSTVEVSHPTERQRLVMHAPVSREDHSTLRGMASRTTECVMFNRTSSNCLVRDHTRQDQIAATGCTTHHLHLYALATRHAQYETFGSLCCGRAILSEFSSAFALTVGNPRRHDCSHHIVMGGLTRSSPLSRLAHVSPKTAWDFRGQPGT